MIKQNIKNNTYKGLGEVLVVSLLMNEIDLKLSNIGVDSQNNIIKIDGDWCFARLKRGFENHNYTINEKDIRYLPFPHSYSAFNWLDAIKEWRCDSNPQGILESIQITVSTKPKKTFFNYISGAFSY